MKFFKYSLSAFLIIFILYAILPSVIELYKNPVSPPNNIQLEKEIIRFHRDLFVSDMHADSLLWRRNLLNESYRGHLDLQRMREGGIDMQFFTVVTKAPRGMNDSATIGGRIDNITLLSILQLWPPATWFSLKNRAVYQAKKLHAYERKDPNFVIVKNKSDLEDFLKNNKANDRYIAGILGLEGAHAIEKNLEKDFIDLYHLGYRMMAPTHFFDNKIAGSMHGLEKYGLSPKGERFVGLANEYNVILDLAHASIATIEDTLKLTTKPLVVSHTGLRGHCDNHRNLPDELAKRIAQTGGLIAIGFWPKAVCGNTIDDIVSALRYAKNLLGIDHIALGSDFDGTVRVPFLADDMEHLTSRLLINGFSKEEIRKVMGENVKEFLLKNLPQ